MEEGMERIFEANDPIEAAILKGLLESYGIEVQLRGADLYGAIGELPVFGLITLWVPKERAEEARARLREHGFL